MIELQNIRDTYSDFINSIDNTDCPHDTVIGNTIILEQLFDKTLEIKEKNENLQSFYDVLYRLYLFGTIKKIDDSSMSEFNVHAIEELKEAYDEIQY